MLHRIDIEYADPCAERIADVIGRLDELGDAVDGTIAAAEAQMMLTRLTHFAPTGSESNWLWCPLIHRVPAPVDAPRPIRNS